MEQVELRFDGSSRPDEAWQVMLKIISGIVDEVGLKEVAFALDMSGSHLSHCLNERNGNNLPAKAIPYFIMKAKTDDLVEFQAALRGLEVRAPEELTPEQRLARIERAMAEELGPAVRAAVMNRAFGRK